MQRLKYLILLIALVGSFFVAFVPSLVGAQALGDQCTAEEAKQTDACKKIAQADLNKFVGAVVNGLLFVLGAMSVLVIIIAGVFYVTSMGDPAIITKAKNALIYSTIGLIVALLSYAIVNFVIGVFK